MEREREREREESSSWLEERRRRNGLTSRENFSVKSKTPLGPPFLGVRRSEVFLPEEEKGNPPSFGLCRQKW